jgi:hypothetical protein
VGLPSRRISVLPKFTTPGDGGVHNRHSLAVWNQLDSSACCWRLRLAAGGCGDIHMHETRCLRSCWGCAADVQQCIRIIHSTLRSHVLCCVCDVIDGGQQQCTCVVCVCPRRRPNGAPAVWPFVVCLLLVAGLRTQQCCCQRAAVVLSASLLWCGPCCLGTFGWSLDH